MLDIIIAADTALFFFINRFLSNPVLDFLMPYISHLGSVWLWAVASFLILPWKRLLGKRLIIGGIFLNILVVIIKGVLGRSRPYEILSNVNVLDTGVLASFPSGHTANIFLGAFLLSMAFPKYKVPFFIGAALVGISRIYVGMHFPLDVLAGAVLGIVVGYIVVENIPEKKAKKRRRKQ